MQGKPQIQVVAAVIVNAHRQILITQRPPGSHLPGFWEFPGGKIDKEETPERALKREIKEELDAEIEVKKLLWNEHFEYPEKEIYISFYACRLISDPQHLKPLEVADFRWISLEQIDRFQFPPADDLFIKKLKREFSLQLW